MFRSIGSRFPGTAVSPHKNIQLETKCAYYAALEAEYQAESDITAAKKQEGYAREIDCKSVQAKLTSLKVDQKLAKDEFAHMKQKLERYSGLSIDSIQQSQLTEMTGFQRDIVLQGFREANTLEKYNQSIAEIYRTYVNKMKKLLNQVNEKPLIELTQEIEPTTAHTLYEQELKQYLESEIRNYEIEAQICELQCTQYDIDIELYVTKLCDAVMNYADKYKAIQAELEVLSQQKVIQNALYEEGMGRRYEIFQIETKIKEREYQKQEIIYQYMRVLYMIDNHIENQEM